jgi:type IV pilus assembly protein PilM
MDLLLVAARRERVRDLQALAEAVGLKPVVVDVAEFAARRAVRQLLAVCPRARVGRCVEPTFAVLDLRADRIAWRLSRGDEVLHDNECAWSPVAPALPGETDPALEVATGLALAWSSALASDTGARIEAIWLTGEVNNGTGLATALAGLLGCPCRVANPFEGMAHRRAPPWRIAHGTRGAASTAPATGAASAYLPACGLALRRFQP